MIRSVNDTTRQGDKSDTSSVETNTARFGGRKVCETMCNAKDMGRVCGVVWERCEDVRRQCEETQEDENDHAS